MFGKMILGILVITSRWRNSRTPWQSQSPSVYLPGLYVKLSPAQSITRPLSAQDKHCDPKWNGYLGVHVPLSPSRLRVSMATHNWQTTWRLSPTPSQSSDIVVSPCYIHEYWETTTGPLPRPGQRYSCRPLLCSQAKTDIRQMSLLLFTTRRLPLFEWQSVCYNNVNTHAVIS